MIIFGISFSPGDLWLLGICGTIIMAAIGFYFTNLNSRLNRLAIASANFRNVFLTDLKGLYPVPSEWPKDSLAIERILKRAFPNLQSAVTEFRHFIPWYRRKCFDRAWQEYHEDYYQYMPFITTSNVDGKQVTEDTTKTYKDTFRHNVDKLLSYAKQT